MMLYKNLYLVIYLYIYNIIFFLMFLTWISFFELYNTNINFKTFFSNFFMRWVFFGFITSLIGIPPLFGFFVKFILLWNLIFFKKYLIFVLILLINLFLLVFYLNQLRFLQSNFKKKFFSRKKYKLKTSTILFLLVVQFINLFSLVFLPFIIQLFW
jgi:NADH:ubiquinone oxidoreductase subunit 2 (subunit N)